ncbi:FecCD family ABC transporter permease [Aquabacterium sp.]|uniref:FecCD family ABC transporter permease n=1 Tax=Aquabacterium sp. TaxID=1872578 RepID=UPI003D6CABE8
MTSRSPVSAPRHLSARMLALIGTTTLVLALAFGATQGAYPIPLNGLWTLLTSPAPWATHPDAQVFFHIRAPRLLMALLSGAGLGLTGAVVQGLYRNPLADPSLIGVTSGAALGAGVAIVLGSAMPPEWWSFLGPSLPLLTAFLGGLLVTALVWRWSSIQGQVRLPLLLLMGVAVNALAASGLGWLSFMANDAQLRSLTFWLLGSLSGTRWNSVAWATGPVLLALWLTWRLAPQFNALALGEAQARLMGVPVDRLKRHGVWWSALVVGVLTAHIGMVGFVGLIAPHGVRLLVGADHRAVLPGSALLGAILVILADTASRTVVAPVELPLGVLTGLLGAPLFLWMLRQRHATV